MQSPLRRSNVSFQQIVELSPDGVLLVDGDGRIGFANRRLAEMTGYADGELLGQRVEILVPDGQRSDHVVARAAGDEQPTERPMGVGRDIFCRRKDGSCFPADIASSPVAVEGDTITAVTVRDATASRRADQAWVEAERRWKDLLEGVHLAVVGLDNDHRVVFANPFFLSLTGYEEHEVMGAEWFSAFVSPESSDEVQEVFERVLDASGADRHVNPIVTKQGEQRLIAWFNTTRHSPDGSVVGTLSIGEDITDRVRVEARLRAVSEVTQGVLSDKPLDDLLRLLAGQARQLVGADTSSIVLPQGDEALAIAATDGSQAERLEGMVLPREGSMSGPVMSSRTGELVEDAARDPRVCQLIVELGEIGPALFVPLIAGDRVLGTLLVANRRGGRRFSPDDLAVVESVASHASIAVEYRRAQQEMQRLVVMEDRERIARDLHDLVIQRLFATALSLTAVRKQAREPLVSERVADAVEELDRTISDVRTSIFELRRRDSADGLREQLLAVLDEAAGPLGFRPQARFVGLLDTSIGDDISRHVLVVIREALSNVARHARARQVFVLVEVGAELVVRVTDDGIGIPVDVALRSGLKNLEARAGELGGILRVGSGEKSGTVLEWRTPLGRPHPQG